MAHERTRSRGDFLTKAGLVASGAALLAACGTRVETGEATAPAFNQPNVFIVSGLDKDKGEILLRGCAMIGSATGVEGVEIFGDDYTFDDASKKATLTGGSVVWKKKAGTPDIASSVSGDPQKLADQYGKTPRALSNVPEKFHLDDTNDNIVCEKRIPVPVLVEGPDIVVPSVLFNAATFDSDLLGAVAVPEVPGTLTVLARPAR
jgi:hypothetical protein